MEIQSTSSASPYVVSNLHRGKQNLASVPFKSDPQEKIQQGNEQQNKQGGDSKPESRFSTRKVIDAFTVTFYAALVTGAIAINKCKPTEMKKFIGLTKTKEAQKVAKDELIETGKIMSGEYGKQGPLYKSFNYFRKLKENSHELTNNLVYGFGTLVVMPLVILFSPIGKKDASKEDRMFTVLRQPISFATVFAVQLTFDKIFKTLATDLNKYGLLDKVKGKDGKELFFSPGRIKEVLKEDLAKLGQKSFAFNQKALEDKVKFKNEIAQLKEHIEGANLHFERKGAKYPINIEGKGNNFTLEQFSDSITNLISNVGENLSEKSGAKQKIDNLQELLKPYTEKIPGFAEKLTNMAKSQARSKALKETSVVVSNSIISQALGIMMLNFLYGKMTKSNFMKKVVSQTASPAPQDKPVQAKVDGGVNNAN